MKNRTTLKVQAFLQLFILLGIIVLINFLAARFHKRFDLTKEKRYTLSETTKQMLNNLDGDVYVNVYLEGDFPAGFKRLRNATEDMLYEFKEASGGKIQYVFINPAKGSDQEKKALQEEIYKKGLNPTNLRLSGEESKSEQVIFPGMLMNYRSNEIPVQLLENEMGVGPDEALNNSIELLEYKIASAIRTLTMKQSPRVRFLIGEGELERVYVADLAGTLKEFKYDVEVTNLTEEISLVNKYDLVIVAKPLEKFTEPDKFKLDQFIMSGGSVLWLIDKVNMDLDSMRGKSETVAVANDLNLDDQLFHYGVRLNADLVQDLQCSGIPIVVGQGNPPQTDFFPWVYYPLITSGNRHAIVKNLDAVLMKFAGTIDTVRVPGVKKTILLTTSKYSKALMAPVRIQFSMLKEKPNPATFNEPNLPVAVLLEGKFTSVFKGRLVASTLQMLQDSLHIKYREESDYSKMIVVSDGDVIRNSVSSQGTPYPLGYYPYTQQTFANKDFLLNCIEYLSDNSNLIETRNKEIKLRMLDRTRIKEEKLKWRLVNLFVPIGIIVLFGLIYNFIRRRKYAA